VRLTSANSISLGRLVPQVFFHAFAATQAPASKPLVISVPTGNLGNLVAGVIAWKLGAPIQAFSAPTTVNDTLPRYLDSGRVEPRRSVATLANAMDVGNPSNLERLQWLFNGDLKEMRALITSKAHTDDEVRAAIGELQKKYSYVADPHSAIAYLGVRGRSNALFLATAHPAKFRDVVEPVIGVPVPLPDPLVEALARNKTVQRISPVLGELVKLL
jgi:threonine synthase